MIRRPAIAVFLQPPRLGEVKPALSAEIGPHHAVRLYRVLTTRTLAAVRELDLPAAVWFTPADAQSEMRRWLGPSWELRAQAPGSLGHRISAAAQGMEPGAPWIVILSECVGLEPEVLRSACDALIDCPAVMGPTRSGGCYLVGARGPIPGFAGGLASGAFATARVLLDEVAPGWHQLPMLSTIDTSADAREAGLLP